MGMDIHDGGAVAGPGYTTGLCGYAHREENHSEPCVLPDDILPCSRSGDIPSSPRHCELIDPTRRTEGVSH